MQENISRQKTTIPLHLNKTNQHKEKKPREVKRIRDMITPTSGAPMETVNWKP